MTSDECMFELYRSKSDYINILIEVNLSNKIIISGYESGNVVNKINGGSDYEYYLTINKINTILFKVIKGLRSSEEVKDFFIKNFSNEDCIEQIKKFCSNNVIKYEFSVWR